MVDKNIDDIILSVLQGTCSSEEKAFLDEWIHHSARNEQYYREEMRDLRRYRLIANLSRGEEIRDEVAAGLERMLKKRKISRYLRGGALAASVLLLVSWGIWFYGGERETEPAYHYIEPGRPMAYLRLQGGQVVDLSAQRENAYLPELKAVINKDSSMIKYHADTLVPVYHELIVPAGGEYSLKLADGTRVHVNAGSRLLYPTHFDGETREVFLSGEAYFEVTRAKDRPFIVHAGEVDIHVRGTSFNVNAYEENRTCETTLEEGSVEIHARGKSRYLSPGEQCVYDKKVYDMQVRTVETELFTSWRNGYYTFKRMPLEKILNTLSLWYDVKVKYEDWTLKNIRFSGKLKRFEDIQHLLNKFEQTGNVCFTLRDKEIVVKKHRE